MNTQAQLKALKKEIVNQTAINVGYYEEVLKLIPAYALTEAVKEIALQNLIQDRTNPADIQNMLVTEAVKAMNFQDFKEIATYFFNFRKLSA